MFIITGVSKGLGRSLANKLLEEGELVTGIGRNNSIIHPNYKFIQLDLANIEAIKNFDITIPNSSITLINNAGIIGEIKRLSDQEEPDILSVLNVNTIAPVLLTNLIYSKVDNKEDFRLVNISSGAANRPIPSWAAYCASKAALNMLTNTFYLEEKEKGNNLSVYAVAPGVIDSDMQVQIRNAPNDDFSAVENFRNLKTNGELYSADEAADRLLILLSQPYDDQVFHDLRDM